MNAISALYSKLIGIDRTIDPMSEVLVTNGAYGALFTGEKHIRNIQVTQLSSALMGHINPGDEVIIIEPYFDCYEPMVRVAGGTPVFIPLLVSLTERA